MDHFEYRDGQLYAEDVALSSIAQAVGTPCYVYSRATLEHHWRIFDKALGAHPHLICFAVKANSNIAVLNVLAKLGSGFDIVSGGELARVLAAGGDPQKVVFSGVGKQTAEIRFALQQGIHCFNVESYAELDRINMVAAELDVQAPISLRINPNVDAKTHPYISTGLKANKFGIAHELAVATYEYAQSLSHLNIIGMDCHIGSQLTDILPFVDALKKLLELVDQLSVKGIEIKHLDIGGGLGVTYKDETPPHPFDYAEAIAEVMQGRENMTLVMEPGRAIAANAGVMLTQVEFLKTGEEKNFCMVDAAMNDLLRPALYQAWQAIVPLDQNLQRTSAEYDVVGPVCETGDFLGKDRQLGVAAGDYLAVKSAGAYGFVMASNYNTRPRAAEVMVDGDAMHVIRQREPLESLWALESTLAD